MQIKFKKEVSLSPDEIKDILIKFLHSEHGLSGIFDVGFVIKNKPIPSGLYPGDSMDHWVFDGAEIKVSTNET